MIWGAIAGGISLLLLPHGLIEDPALRVVNLVVTPVIVGAAMMVVGHLREKHGKQVLRIDRFGFAYAFALSMALVRFVWAG